MENDINRILHKDGNKYSIFGIHAKLGILSGRSMCKASRLVSYYGKS